MDLRHYFKRSGENSGSEAAGMKLKVEQQKAVLAKGGGLTVLTIELKEVAKHAVGCNPKWKDECVWLVPERDEAGVVAGECCSFC